MKKRVLSLILAALTLLAFCAPAFAAEEAEPDEEVGLTPTANPFAASIVTDDSLSQTEDASGIRGGTNQNDAVLLPMNANLYGTAMEDPVWYAFTTLSDPDITYTFVAVNLEVDAGQVRYTLYDAAGAKIAGNYDEGYYLEERVDDSGRADSFVPKQLAPDTVYYINLWATEGSIDYRLSIIPQGVAIEGYATTDNVLDARGSASAAEGLIAPGTNMDDAGYLPLNAKITASINDYHGLWFAFTTNGAEGDYSISMVNETTGSEKIGMRVVDVYGSTVKANNYTDGYYAYSKIENDGRTVTTTFSGLELDTTYYIELWTDSDSQVQYTMTINAPVPPATPAPVTVEPLIFETPFELNETRVMFVGDKAIFVDEEAANEACAPVAEVILAHPDHKVLLVGTTASNGSDGYCLDLSSRRAAAVKDLLVSAYGVPEEQLLTVGLGYKLDPFARANDLDANGRLIESEACKNRRVIVLDAEDPIALEILGENAPEDEAVPVESEAPEGEAAPETSEEAPKE